MRTQSATRLRLCYLANDLVMSLAAVMMFDTIRYALMPPGSESRPFRQWLFHDTNIVSGMIIFPLMMLGIYALSGYYDNVRAKSRLDDIYNSLVAGLAGTLIIYFITLIDDYLPVRTQNYQLLMMLWMCLSLPVCLGRTVITGIQRRVLRASGGIYPALIVGDRQSRARIARRLAPRGQRSIPAFRIVAEAGTDISDGDLRELVSKSGARAIIVTPHPDGLQHTMDLLARLYPAGPDIYLPADLYQLITSRTRTTNVVGEPLINISGANIPPSTANIKRVSDVIFSALALSLLAPVFALVALAIRLDSDGPVFYTQERVGRHKRLFRIIKFRTMHRDAEPCGPALSVADDPRITRMGRLLRKYRIDELPQFWNVLRGDMSIVGPRPERPYFVEQIVNRVPHYSLVHQVRPGITSWGMVKYGYASSIDEMIERLPYDLLYIENVSFAVDAKILFHTVSTVLTGKGL